MLRQKMHHDTTSRTDGSTVHDVNLYECQLRDPLFSINFDGKLTRINLHFLLTTTHPNEWKPSKNACQSPSSPIFKRRKHYLDSLAIFITGTPLRCDPDDAEYRSQHHDSCVCSSDDGPMIVLLFGTITVCPATMCVSIDQAHGHAVCGTLTKCQVTN